jgi:hypothetical protein
VNTKVKIADDLNTELTIEKVTQDADLKQLARDAAFMEEEVVIEIVSATTENDPPCVVLNVNGVNQPVWRGVPSPIKRKYLEVLARMKETRYSQLATNYINPEVSNALQPRTGIVYPFQVISDKNPKGAPWLRRILAEAA